MVMIFPVFSFQIFFIPRYNRIPITAPSVLSITSVISLAPIAMYLCREMLDAPLTGIGKMMGDRDHTTVMHGIEKIEKEMSAKDSVRNTVDILKKKINPSK